MKRLSPRAQLLFKNRLTDTKTIKQHNLQVVEFSLLLAGLIKANFFGFLGTESNGLIWRWLSNLDYLDMFRCIFEAQCFKEITLLVCWTCGSDE